MSLPFVFLSLERLSLQTFEAKKGVTIKGPSTFAGEQGGLQCKAISFEDTVAFSGGTVTLASGSTTTGIIAFPELVTQHGTTSKYSLSFKFPHALLLQATVLVLFLFP